MKPSVLKGERLPPVLLIVLGAGIIVLALVADLIGLDYREGFSTKQQRLAAIGLLVLASGIGLLTPAGQRVLRDWYAQVAAYSRPARSSREALFRFLSIAASLGLICGLAEGLIYWLFGVIPDPFGWRKDLLPDILWVAPVFNALLFMAAGGAIFLLIGRLRGVSLDLLGYAGFGWLAILGPLVASGRLRRSASLLLATGVVVQFLQYALARRPARNAFLARSFASLAAAVVFLSLAGLAFGVPATVPAGPREPVAQSKAPNVLLIVLDTLRADHLSSYGYARPTTPNLDRLAQQGVLFEEAYATASWTLPSHATLFTGRYPYEHRAGVKPLDTRYPTLAEVLYVRGYATAGFSANTYYVTPATGLTRGFEHFEVYYHSVTDMVARTFYGDFLLDRLPLLGYYDRPGRKRAAEVNREFLSWVKKKGDTPFFAFLNYFEVHDPYLASPPYQTRFTENPTRGNRINTVLYPHDFTGGKPFSPQEIQTEIDGYDASLVYLDAELGNLFDGLAALGILDNTVVIITSDHGEAFGTHGFFGHGNSMYRELLHVPLIIRFPAAVPIGLRVRDVVSLQALPATVMDLIGRGSEQPFSGRSWATCWAQSRSDEPCAGDFAFSDASPSTVPESKFGSRRRAGQSSVFTSAWHLILYAEGDAALYRVRDDPQELSNLADTPEGRQVVRELMTRMDERLPSGD